jgi:hypothetical protein
MFGYQTSLFMVMQEIDWLNFNQNTADYRVSVSGPVIAMASGDEHQMICWLLCTTSQSTSISISGTFTGFDTGYSYWVHWYNDTTGVCLNSNDSPVQPNGNGEIAFTSLQFLKHIAVIIKPTSF